MSRWIYMSYMLNEQTPAYGNGETFSSKPLSYMERGDSCNTANWNLPNHIGTHIDFSRHFVVKGKTLNDYPASFWHFKSVHLVFTPKVEPGRVIGPDDLRITSIPKETELLLIKTGFGSIRHQRLYWEANPAYLPELADVLRERCLFLRVVGFDSISLSSWINRSLGREAHKAFLDHPRPILLLEDMNLLIVCEETIFRQVVVSPLSVANADGSPCTVLAEVD